MNTASGSNDGAAPCVPVTTWLHGKIELGYTASPNGRTCTVIQFSPSDAVFRHTVRTASRNASSLEQSVVCHSK